MLKYIKQDIMIVFVAICAGVTSLSLGGAAYSAYLIYDSATRQVAVAPTVVIASGQEEQYYRGVFDVCMVLTSGDKPVCVEAVQLRIAANWYGDTSEGWSAADYKFNTK